MSVFAAQRDRWVLWLAPAVVAGAAAWLGAPGDPPIWGPGLLFLGGLALALVLSLRPGERPRVDPVLAFAALAALACAFGLGASAAQWRAASVAQPAYIESEEPVRVEGWVMAINANDSGPRLRLLVSSIEGQQSPPRFVRVAVPRAGVLTPGRAARCRAVLGPPAGPLAPRAYDFSRRAYFEQLGATGFSFGRCYPARIEPPTSWLDRHKLRLAALRADLSAEIQHAAPGRGGTIAAALITGDRSSIDADTNSALRDSGLGHLLAVSGIHMGVVGGLVFAFLLWTFSLIPPIALRWPVKKIAAAGALIALSAYLVISGSSVPALRAFVMACVAFGAILLDRPAISMRGLALAAVIVTLLFPESVLEPGFQMSFAATMALVALFEMLKRAPHQPALPTPGPLIGALQAISRGIGAVLLISLVAGLATDAFAIYHFQRFSIYALPANLIAAPIMSFLVAPAAGLAALLAPFGHADIGLELMASALDMIAAIGATFGARPEAVRAMAQPSELALMLCVMAMLWACLWRGPLRLGALAWFAASAAVYACAPTPIAAFDSDLRALYARVSQDGDESWTLMAGRGRSTYARDRLGAMLGVSQPQIERLAAPLGCAETACAWRSPSHTLSFALSREAAPTACDAAILITPHEVSDPQSALCPNAIIIDRADLARYGGGFIYEEEAGALRIERAWPDDVRRPWRAP